MEKETNEVITPGQIQKLLELLGAALSKSGLQSGPVQQVLEHQGEKLTAELVATVRQYVEAEQAKQGTFWINRDGRPVENKAKKGFDYVAISITSKNFTVAPPSGFNLEEAILVNFGNVNSVNSEDAVERLGKMGLRPGLPTELVDLSKNYPGSEQFAAYLPIVALGDAWVDVYGDHRVVCLHGSAFSRELDLDWWDNGWHAHWRFLAFRK